MVVFCFVFVFSMVFLVWLQARPEPDGQKPEMIIVDDVLLVVVSYVFYVLWY